MTHLAGGGFFLSSPPPPDFGRARTRASFYLRIARYWWRATRWPHLVHGGRPPPHPSTGSHTRATSRQYNFQFLIIISNLNVKIDFQSKLCPYTWAVRTSNQILIFKLKFQYYGSSPGYLLRLMFVYTTRDIYLTLSNIQIWNIFILAMSISP